MTRRDDLWLRELYQAQWVPMVRLATLLLGAAEAAADVVADAVLAVHQRREQFESLDQAQQYLRVSVLNRTRSAKRPVAAATRHTEVLAMIEALPQRQREVLVLRYYLDLDESDIARTLGISRTAVSSHAHRGLQSVRDTLAEVGLADD